MHLTFGLTPLFLLVTAAVAAALTYWTYRRTTPQLSSGRRWVLGTLRFAALFLILFLLARPILTRLLEDRVPPVIAVLVDGSESMDISSPVGGSTGADQAREILGAMSELAIPGEVRTFRFASDVVEIPLDSTAAIRFDGQRTDLSAALDAVREDLRDQNLRAVLVVSDGRYNAGRNPARTAERYEVPVFTLTVGDSTEARDVRISRVTTNEITYSGLELPVDIAVSAMGYEGRRATVGLYESGELVDSQTINLPPDGSETAVELSYTPPAPGLRQIEARVSTLEGEITTRNNRTRVAVRVLDSKRRILLIAAAPGPDVSALRRILESDESNEVTVIVQRSGPTYYGDSLPSDLNLFDILVLAGFPGANASPPHLQALASAASSGKPLLFLLSRRTDLRLFREHIASHAGVSPLTMRPAFFEAVTVPTSSGHRHPVMEGLDAVDDWLQLPPLTFNESRWTVAPEADVLATIRVRGIDLDDPAIVVRRSGSRRAAAVMGNGFWRLANLPEYLSDYEDFGPSLIRNLLHWVSAAEDDRPVRVRTTQSEFSGDERVTFEGQVYDESLNPVDDAAVEIVVTAPDGNDFRHVMKPIGSGRYVLDVDSPGEGTFRYSASARRNDAEIGTDAGSFVVGNLTLEFRTTSADPVLMRQTAFRSGGESVTRQQLADLPALLQRATDFVGITRTTRFESELWRRAAFLAAVIALLTCEWILRKRSGLS